MYNGLLSCPKEVTLGEGNTPLIDSVRVGPSRGVSRLLFKLEMCNPTGSYKDRFIAAQVGCMLRGGTLHCLATSSGNTGSSLAAYCARYGMSCLIVVNDNAPAGKLLQMQAHGARVIRVPGFVTEPDTTSAIFATLQTFSEENRVPLVVSAFRYCPEGMRAVQKIASEIAAQQMPDHVFVPVGGGGLYSAVVQGFQECGPPVPRVHAVQPEGCLTTVASFLRGDEEIRPVIGRTRTSGLSVPYDIDATRALQRLRECGGRGISVSDEEVFAAQQMLLEQEGIYCEPAGATALAGWLRAESDGFVRRDEASLCLVTGHGFKDPSSVNEAAERHAARLVESAHVGQALRSLLPGATTECWTGK